MAQMTLPDDFKEFLKLLGARGVEYQLYRAALSFRSSYGAE